MELIRQWLSGSKNFCVGVTLYETLSDDQSLQQLFAQGETPHTKKRLEEVLKAIIAEPFHATMAVLITEAPAASPVTAKTDDPILQAILTDTTAKFQRMKYLQVKLDEYGDDNDPETMRECNNLCREILQLDKKVTAGYEKRDYYLQHGRLPDGPVEEVFIIPTDSLQLARLIETLKKNIRRNKQKARDNPNAPEYPALVKLYEERLKQVYDANKKD